MTPEEQARINSVFEMLYNLTVDEQKKFIALYGVTRLKEINPAELPKVIDQFIRDNTKGYEDEC